MPRRGYTRSTHRPAVDTSTAAGMDAGSVAPDPVAAAHMAAFDRLYQRDPRFRILNHVPDPAGRIEDAVHRWDDEIYFGANKVLADLEDIVRTRRLDLTRRRRRGTL